MSKLLQTAATHPMQAEMAVDLNSFTCKRPFLAKEKYYRESFANPTFIFRGGLMLKSFAKSFAHEKITFANSEQTVAGSHVGSLAAFVMDNHYMDL